MILFPPSPFLQLRIPRFSFFSLLQVVLAHSSSSLLFLYYPSQNCQKEHTKTLQETTSNMTLESTSNPTNRPSSSSSSSDSASIKERGDLLGVPPETPETREVEGEAMELLKGLKHWSKKAGGWIKDHYDEFKENLAITIEGVESVLFSPSSPPATLRRRTKKEIEEAEVEDTIESSELTASTQDPSDSDSAPTPSTSSTSLSSDSSNTSSSSDPGENEVDHEEELEEEPLENDSYEEEEEEEDRKATSESTETNRTLFLVESESDDSWCNIEPESEDQSPTDVLVTPS